jgi:hypothetical protein
VQIQVGLADAGRTLTVEAADTTWRIYDADALVAEVARTTTRPIARFKVHKPEPSRRRVLAPGHPGRECQPGCADLPPDDRVPESSRTNADDRLPLASLNRVEGGDGIVEGRDVADVRPQSSVPHPLDDLT